MADESIPQVNDKSIGDLVSPAILIPEYIGATSSGYIPGIDYLSKKYEVMRRIIGDGNCFYRGFLYGYLEELLRLGKSENTITKDEAKQEQARMIAVLKQSKYDLINIGYSEIAFETFHEMLTELIENLFEYNRDTLLEHFEKDGNADCYTWYMRLLTAGSMRLNADRFLPFVISDDDQLIGDHQTTEEKVALFCSREVEPMGREVEQLQILALCLYLGVQVRLEYLDGREFIESLPLIEILDITIENSDIIKCPFSVMLLYRPGHYDILYPN